MSSSNDKLKNKKLREKRDALQDRAAHMRRKVEELKADIEHTKRDISSRDEQIERKTDQLMSKLQKIKAIDDEKARLLRLLEQSQVQRGAINPKDKLQALMLAVQRMNSGVDGSGGGTTSGETAIMNDLAEMARTSQRLMTRVRVEGGGGTRDGSGNGRNGNNKRSVGELNIVKVWYNKTSCEFKVTDLHTFRDLLDEVIKYWSLQPSKNVLVNAQNFIWPLNASVREVIGALPEGKDDPGAIIKVWNRENTEKVTFDQWILHEEKIQKDREETEQQEQMQRAILGERGRAKNGDASSSSSSGAASSGSSKAPDLGPGSASTSLTRRKKDVAGFPASAYNHEHGMDITKLADQQSRHEIKKQKKKVSGSGTINFCKYVDLFIFLLFISLFGNTLFMRRSIYRAGLVRTGFVNVLYNEANVPLTRSRSQVLYQGLEIGTQSISNGYQNTYETLKFEDINSGAQIWQWIEGPLRSVVTGMMNGTASLGLDDDDSSSTTSATTQTETAQIGKVFLRHNVLVGRPRIAQWRVKESSTDMHCVKPERLDLFMQPCLSQYQAGINQDKGVELNSVVHYLNDENTRYTVTAIDTTTAHHPMYTLESTADSTVVLTEIVRSEISTSSWKSIEQLTNSQRTLIWNNTNGFTFDHQTQAKYDNGLLQYMPTVTGLVSDAIVGGGFSSDLPVDTLDAFDAHMSTLKRNVWIDEKTRAVEIAFNYYNVNYDFLIVNRIVFDLTPGGGVNARKTVKVVRLCDNWRAEDLTRIQLEWVCLGLLVLGYISVLLSACNQFMKASNSNDEQLLDYYNTQAIKNKQSKVRRGKNAKTTNQACKDVLKGCPIRCSRCCTVLFSFWNAIEFILLISLIADLILRWNYQNVIIKYTSSQLFGNEYIDLTWPVISYQTSVNLSSVVMFLSVTKCFK
jgi:hypothetical protein